MTAEPDQRHQGRARARHLRRLDHHRPHLAGRRDQGRIRPPANGCSTTASAKADFNSYGSRRGNHEVMMRGTFANVRIKNLMLPPRADGTREEGGVTLFQPSGEKMFIYDAAMKYIAQGTPTVVFGGEEYGTGSSRDWAAKGTQLLGVKAVIAKSFERIHRSNLVGMGVLPLQFKGSDTAQSLGIKGDETFDIVVPKDIRPQQDLTLVITRKDGIEAERAGAVPHRHADRGRLLQRRRHPAVRAAGSGQAAVAPFTPDRLRGPAPSRLPARIRLRMPHTPPPSPPRAAAVPPGRAVPDGARHDGEVPGARPFAVPGRVGALRRADAGRDAVRLAPRRARLLAHAQPAHAARPLGVPARRHRLLLRRLALPAAGRRLGDHVPRADLHRRALAAGAGRAADARALDRRRSRASPASWCCCGPDRPCCIRRWCCSSATAVFNAFYQLLTRKLPGDSAHTTLFYSALVGAVGFTLALPWGFDGARIVVARGRPAAAAGPVRRPCALAHHQRVPDRAGVAADAVHLPADDLGDAVRLFRVRRSCPTAGRPSAWRSSSAAASCWRCWSAGARGWRAAFLNECSLNDAHDNARQIG